MAACPGPPAPGDRSGHAADSLRCHHRPPAGPAAQPGDRRARPCPGRARSHAGRRLIPVPHTSIPPARAAKEHPCSPMPHRRRSPPPPVQSRAALPPVHPQAGHQQHRVHDPPVRPARQGDRARLGQRPGHRDRHRPGPVRRLGRRPGRIPAARRRGVPGPGRESCSAWNAPGWPATGQRGPCPYSRRQQMVCARTDRRRRPHLRILPQPTILRGADRSAAGVPGSRLLRRPLPPLQMRGRGRRLCAHLRRPYMVGAGADRRQRPGRGLMP